MTPDPLTFPTCGCVAPSACCHELQASVHALRDAREEVERLKVKRSLADVIAAHVEILRDLKADDSLISIGERLEAEARANEVCVRLPHEQRIALYRDAATQLVAAEAELHASVLALRDAREEIGAAERRIAALCDAHEEQFVRADAAEASLASLRQSLASLIEEMEQKVERFGEGLHAVDVLVNAISLGELKAWAQRLRSLVERPGQEQK